MKALKYSVGNRICLSVPFSPRVPAIEGIIISIDMEPFESGSDAVLEINLDEKYAEFYGTKTLTMTGSEFLKYPIIRNARNEEL